MNPLTDQTVKLQDSPQVTVGNLEVEILEGPDAGQKTETDDEVLTIGNAQGNFFALTDRTVSGYHLELTRRKDGIHVKDLGSTNGTLLGDVSLREGVVPNATVLKLGNTRLRVSLGRGRSVEVYEQDHLGDLLGRSEIMRRLMARIQRVALANVPVLLSGESGTGKELVARAIHQKSPRAGKPFVTVDCGVLSPNLVASELFGHEKGSFTGADRQHIGAFERANGGTLFLDEIGELPPELQPQLLGALERRRFHRVGGRQEISIDVRVVSATNRDLRSEVNSGGFRIDLFYRVAVVSLAIPALRQRVEDLPLLVEHFVREAGHDGDLEAVVSAEILAQLRDYRWPGNVRELRNWVEATLAIGEAQELANLDSRPSAPSGADVLVDLPYKDARHEVLTDFETRYCGHLMQACEGNVSQAARRARMDRSYLIKLLQRHGLK